MARPALALAVSAALVAAVDLTHKASTDAVYMHARSPGYAGIVVALGAVWALAILATRSFAIAVGGGIVLGGAVGNVVSLAFWPGVPDPIVLGPVAFNLADVFVLCGFVLVCAAAVAFAAANRARLREPLGLR